MLKGRRPVVAATGTGTHQAIARIGCHLTYLDHLVHDLMDQALIDGRALRLELAPTELRGLLGEVLAGFSSTLDAPRVALEAAEPMVVLADRARIARVVSSLMRHALRGTPRSAPVVVRLEARTNTACVSVTDQGPGLSAAQLPHVFDRALGLFVSAKLIEAHGGRITVSSVSGRGCRFAFELPFHR